jgi:hypothetical protein
MDCKVAKWLRLESCGIAGKEELGQDAEEHPSFLAGARLAA